jgi:hypothetical protein
VLRLADLHADESLENGSRIFDRGGIWQFAKDLLAAAPAAPAPFDWPKLEQPAKVGAITFGNGVSTRHVVEAAQRQHERAQAEARLTPEDAQAAERARRDLWDMLNGAPAAPAPAEQWPSGIDIADEIDALLPVSMGYSTRAAVEAWWRDLVARKLCKVAAAPAPALCHNCAADGRCMKRQALCAANGTAPAAPAPEPMVVPQSGPCDHDFASGHEEGYAEGWNAAIEAMRGAAPAAPAQVPLTDERVAFEDWADPQELDLSQYLSADQSYVDSDTQAAWMAWQARAAIAASKGGADA